jgi:phage baseplate assembly protein W
VADIPHISFPFQRGADGHLEVVEQDTPEHVLSCENMIVRCPRGWRTDRPEFGWPFPQFRNAPINLDALRDALARFEPRGRADVSEYLDAAEAAQHISIDVEA